MGDEYKTLDGPAEGIYREKGSKFMAFGFSVQNEEEVKEIMARLRREYHDARHQCYAFRISGDDLTVRHNDDGEPAGTAGKPIYHAIEASDMWNVLVVVVRYFGGVLLGRNRLANAYRSAALDMFSHARSKPIYREQIYRISFPYSQLHAVMKILKDEGIAPISPDLGNTCSMFVGIRESKTELVHRRFAAIAQLVVSPADDKEQFSENIQNNSST